MRGHLTSLQNKLWELKSRPRPKFADFARRPSKELEQACQGAVAKLFFANDEGVVHKWLHYLPIYERLFSPFVGTPVRFLEIGVCKGGSLKMWRGFFGDPAVIFGVDIDPSCMVYDGRYGHVRIGSQSDADFMRRVVEEMEGIDVVLDDGSHLGRDQRRSFETLFPLLSDGGLYVIEDLQTAYWPQLEGGVRRPGTIVEYLKGKIDEMHELYYKRGLNTSNGMIDIESIQFYDALAVVVKRKQLPRSHVMVP